MFLFGGMACSDENNRLHPVGEKHAVLIFIVADDASKAEDRIAVEMKKRHWKDIVVDKSKKINEPAIKSDTDKTFVDAFHSAQESRL